MDNYAFGGTQQQNPWEMNWGAQGVAPSQDLGMKAIGMQGQQPFAFGDIGLDQIGAGAGIAKDLYGMFATHKGLGMAKDQMKLQKQAYMDNKANRDRFQNQTAQAFA